MVLGACCFGPPSSPCADVCATTGACTTRPDLEHVYECYAGSDADCAGSAACRDDGLCAATEDGLCVRPEDVQAHRCATSNLCLLEGRCHSVRGACVPESAADCVASLQCIAHGRCSLDATFGYCYARDSADCAGSTGCSLEGICTWEPLSLVEGGGYGHCALTATGHCEGTLACQRDGRCVPLPPIDCARDCTLYYCGREGMRATLDPCTEIRDEGLLVCAPDGRCMRGADGVCAHL